MWNMHSKIGTERVSSKVPVELIDLLDGCFWKYCEKHCSKPSGVWIWIDSDAHDSVAATQLIREHIRWAVTFTLVPTPRCSPPSPRYSPPSHRYSPPELRVRQTPQRRNKVVGRWNRRQSGRRRGKELMVWREWMLGIKLLGEALIPYLRSPLQLWEKERERTRTGHPCRL